MPSTTTVFFAYTSLPAFVMLIRTIANEAKSILTQFMPEVLQRKFLSIFRGLFGSPSSLLTLVNNEYNRDKNITVTVEKDQDIIEVFEGIQVTWKLICNETDSTSGRRKENKFLELSFHKQYKNIMLDSYMPNVLKKSKAIREENRALKLYSLGFYGDGNGDVWGSINLDHPATFDTLAMDTKIKKEL
ncbi:hypothetical protein IFM89_010721 [Coptis chinensis]|uniref:AAA-type ATPase N-terminal domain-containing protein n=1 Tax=Coptis chinensis TaxID=261450 RepID=A0A835ILB8_9MAGN|nr:hypothetical protein IFM89_010721 [Coptis chinensis]